MTKRHPRRLGHILAEVIPKPASREEWAAFREEYDGPGLAERMRSITQDPAFGRLGVVELRVLILVASIADRRTGFAWPGRDAIRGCCPAKPSRAGRAIKALEGHGFLQKMAPGGGRGRAAVYRLNGGHHDPCKKGGQDAPRYEHPTNAETGVTTPRKQGSPRPPHPKSQEEHSVPPRARARTHAGGGEFLSSEEFEKRRAAQLRLLESEEAKDKRGLA